MKTFGKALKKPFLKKHASLELSVNAIVVLILAIAMLGLGLGFTKVMFSKLKGAIEIPEPENPATEDQPLVFNKETIDGKVGQPLGFSVNVYNSDPDPSPDVVVTIPQCTGDVDFSSIESAAQTIPGRSSVTFKMYIPKDSVTAGGGVCTVSAELANGNIVSRQLTFQIAGGTGG